MFLIFLAVILFCKDNKVYSFHLISGESSIPQEISSDWYNAEPRPLTTGELNEWQPIIGKKYDRLRSTQFCINYVMMAVVEARKEMQNANHLQRKLSRSIDEYSQEYNTESIPAKIRVEERVVYSEEIPRFDEAFICSTVRGLVPVSQIGSHKLHTTRDTSVYQHIHRLYMTWAEVQLGHRVEWTTGKIIKS